MKKPILLMNLKSILDVKEAFDFYYEGDSDEWLDQSVYCILAGMPYTRDERGYSTPTEEDCVSWPDRYWKVFDILNGLRLVAAAIYSVVVRSIKSS